jgi:glutamate--cysteine ligase
VRLDEMRFLEALALWCLLHDGPPITAQEQVEIDHNQQEVARFGRRPGCELRRGGRSIRLADWAREICAELGALAEMLDAGLSDTPFARVVADAQAAVEEPARTPSARVLAEMRARGESFVAFAQRCSSAHQRYYRESCTLAPERLAALDEEARVSLEAQAELEASDKLSFDDYLARYFSGADNLCDQPATS